MFYTVSLYVSLIVFGIGLIFKISNWFRISVDPEAKNIPVSARIVAAARGIVSAFLSKKFFVLLKVFVLDVLLQVWLLRKDFARWFAHMCIYGGFVLLLLMHGLDKLVTSALFPDYYSTLNPFMFLRDFFGALVFIGIALVLYRRFFARGLRPKTVAMDYFAIIIVAVIIISGLLLEGTKIVSHSRYEEMVEEYAGLDEAEDAEELRALEAYWVKAFGVVSPNVRGPFDDMTLQQGRELHEMSCVDCHSSPYWAFMGYGVAKVAQPIALTLDRVDMHTFLWYLHFLACFLGLAWLPFSKFFHIFATPVNLLTNAVIEEGKSYAASRATKQAIELDACTHCGECTMRCSVSVAYGQIPNPNILPSEKLAVLKAMAEGKQLSNRQLRIAQEGNDICTDCHRCTDVCPVGINLEAMWFSMRDDLARLGYPKSEAWAKGAIKVDYDLNTIKGQTLPLTPADKGFSSELKGSAQASTFSVCFGCENCTNVCPIIGNYQDPKGVVGLMPHQIMHALALGRRDLALGSGMLWDCVTCYLCQEHCPQGVDVTDVLYELKNLAFRHLSPG